MRSCFVLEEVDDLGKAQQPLQGSPRPTLGAPVLKTKPPHFEVLITGVRKPLRYLAKESPVVLIDLARLRIVTDSARTEHGHREHFSIWTVGLARQPNLTHQDRWILPRMLGSLPPDRAFRLRAEPLDGLADLFTP
jgi:hypothetical protein